ncbi:ATP-binding protein [Thiotrichales bacterium 19S3-7]|nr:ATP-binding protein [Thiotrichales bacterium 19S3-7]MCF6800906.1 ATP-binding protein [Thiotrichales bacterium 19S3-11]
MKLAKSLKRFNKRLRAIYSLPHESVSMHRILNISLFIFITIIMGFLTLVNYVQLDKQNEKLFNIQMVHAAGLVDVLVSMNIQHTSLQALAKLLNSEQAQTITQQDIKAYTKPQSQEFYNIYREAFFFQVYNLKDHHMLLKSSNAPNLPLDVPYGFSTAASKDSITTTWYVFSMKSQYQPVRIVIAINQGFKNQVVMELFWTLLKEIIWLYVISAVMLMILVRIIFAPLLKITQALKKRNPRSIEPLVVKKIPKEVQPLLDQLNRLFMKFNRIIERESRFAGDAAHELKTPLAGIKAQIEVAMNLDDIDLIKEKMQIALKNMDRYYHIIDQLLTLTRLEPAEALKSKVETIEVNRFAAEWIAEMVPLAMKKSIELSLSRSDKPIYILASHAALDVLFRNLLDNAIRYTPNEGQVILAIELEEKMVLISFSDDGPGVEAEHLERIFDRFYRQTGTKEQGSGLGLSIVKEVVRLHDGKVSAKQANGGGLEVQIRLPICHNDRHDIKENTSKA